MAFVDFEQRGPIGVITMNRPEALNALNDQVLKDLDAVLDAAEANDEVLVLILTGAGRSFVAGADIGQMKDFTPVQAKQFRHVRQQRVPEAGELPQARHRRGKRLRSGRRL